MLILPLLIGAALRALARCQRRGPEADEAQPDGFDEQGADWFNDLEEDEGGGVRLKDEAPADERRAS
jgi:hypothetical protein